MIMKSGNREMEMDGKYLTELKASSNIDDTDQLRNRMATDGYLLFRNFHDRNKVLQVRQDMLARLAQEPDRVDPSFPIIDGVVGPNPKQTLFGGTCTDMPSLLEVSDSPKLMQFFDRFLGGETITYDYKWPRVIPPGGATGVHYDIVYMGRGTRNLYTVWTPLGDVPMEMGALALCLGSQHFDQVKKIYGSLDVERDKTKGGILTDNAFNIVDKFGGIWASTDFQAGDILIFGMFMLHHSLQNTTNRYRTSMDTRYQLRAEPIDERWVGKSPVGDFTSRKLPDKVSMETYRDKLGLN
jgi:ectoine hydroxylase-related dioxygenase (phytanoyl-CoA dioxygenase family)